MQKQYKTVRKQPSSCLKTVQKSVERALKQYKNRMEISPHSPRLRFHENYLLADYFTLISLRILGKFLWNFSEMLKSIFSLCTDPLPSMKIGEEGAGGGGVCTQPAINLRLQKGIALLTLPVNNNLYTCNLHCLLHSRLYSNIIRSLQATPEH